MDEEERAEDGVKASEQPAQKKEKPSVASRGIPSSESLYLPSHYSGELRAFQDKEERPMKFMWRLEEVMNFVFPKRYQAKYHEVALAFMQEMTSKLEMGGKEIGAFIASHGISKATFYNRVLPRLKRVGMLKVERETIVALEGKRKFRPMKISLSGTFGNYLVKIGESWQAIVDDARSRKKE
ncbi:MAG: hypothetical protein Q7T16_05850 [Candidatus Burarchaeum sp.]|nr:hypothetical protein [Candidatus Burarchaeum sp.]MDO8340150.1 hypothetical protein [Candidatus Burarchaeum sp.]